MKAGGGSKTRNLTNGNQRPKAGPQIDPAVRYWALRRNDSFMITLWTRVLAFWVVLCVSFEIAIYVLIKQHDLKCTWYVLSLPLRAFQLVSLCRYNDI